MSSIPNADTQTPTEPESKEVTIESFRKAMRALAGGVAAVIVGQDEDRTGFTVTSVDSLSAQPPRLLVSVSVSEDSCSWKALRKCPYFGVNVLRTEQQNLADHFAGRGGVHGPKDIAEPRG